jgi:GNAT superfamily N-acetyltransferase
MRFRWDWLEPVMRAPYIPTLGPVPTTGVSAEIFDAVLSVASTGRFLPCDKGQRWSTTKDERVLAEAIIHSPQQTLIPTLTSRGGGLVKLHHYALDDPDPVELGRLGERLAAVHDARIGHRIVWFPSGPGQARTKVMVKTFGVHDDEPVDQVEELEGCVVAHTFEAFAAEIGPEGFQFLYQRMKAGHQDGPVLVAVEDKRIVGAVGPLSLMTGPDGRLTQLPAYFAVHPHYRNRGHGRRLWKASMAWGRRRGAQIKVLQAAIGTAAEALYTSEGLRTVGYVANS